MSARTSSRSLASASLTDLAMIFARAYLRLAKKSRRDAVSRADAEQKPLDVSRRSRPDERVERDVRRAG